MSGSPKVKPAVLKGIRRNRFVYAFLRIACGKIFCKISHFRYEPYMPQNEPFLFMANHNLDLDPLLVACAMKRHMKFVASANLTRGFWGSIIAYLENPISKRKGADSQKTVDLIKDNLYHGVNVAMHPEGYKSWYGETGFISPRTGDLVKESCGSLITYRMEGGYLQNPRWAKHSRKGPVYGRVVREYSREELSQMSVAEINDAVRKDLHVDAFQDQRKKMEPYYGKDLAEKMEAALYLCPACLGFDTLKSYGDTLSCRCGYTVRYNKYGFLEGENLFFDTILAWDKWQRGALKALVEENRNKPQILITADDNVALYAVEKGTKTLLSTGGTLEVYGDRIVYRNEKTSYHWPIKTIRGMGNFRKSRIFIDTEEAYYELYRKKQISGIKYFALYRYLSGKDYQ